MSHAGRLAGLAFAAVDHSERPPIAFIANGVAAIPKFGIIGFVEHFFDWAIQFAVFNLPEEIPAKLEIDAVLVDGETALTLDVNSVLGIGDQRQG